ncbi:MAG: hypothetical protein R3Y06_10090 [Faecalibacterium sp.]
MICDNCGGTFAADVVSCPYCGAAHLAGATAAHQAQINEMTDELEALGNSQRDAFQKSFTQQKKTSSRLVFIIGGVLFCLFVIPLFFIACIAPNVLNVSEEKKLQLAWQSEAYPTLDALYEQGDFDAIIAYEDALLSDADNFYSLEDWSHYDFLCDYRVSLATSDGTDVLTE